MDVTRARLCEVGQLASKTVAVWLSKFDLMVITHAQTEDVDMVARTHSYST